MALYLEPGTIVECPAGDGPNAGKNLGSVRDSGAAAGTELDAQPPVAFVRAMLEADWGCSRKLDVMLIEVNDHGEGASRAALAECAMTNSGADRLSRGPVPDRSAKTSAFMNFRHAPLPTLSRKGRAGLGS